MAAHPGAVLAELVGSDKDILQPLSLPPRHPLLLARMGACGALPASTLARRAFKKVHTRALFAGMAAHSFLSRRSLSAARSELYWRQRRMPWAGRFQEAGRRLLRMR